MKTITCASYYGTGSSAVTDYISEFSGVKSLTNYEFRFAHDPDGLSELEYNLIENFNRHNSGHALKRYKKLVDYYGNHFLVRRYEPYFGNQWKKLSYEYIDSLTDFSFKGAWQYDYYDRGPWFEFWHKLPNRIFKKTVWRNSEKAISTLKNEITLVSHPSETKFLEVTRKYTDSLLQVANKENEPILMVDQILPSSNIERHLRYFNNMQVVVTDRDPRDLFLLGKYVWNDSIVPRDLDIFCKWYVYARSTREQEHWDSAKILLLQFEDLIYKYDETTAKIREWVGLSEVDHVNPNKYLDPSKSIKNTRLWVQYPEYKAEADEIAMQLPNYLYNIPRGDKHD